jgi:hypothetical protein
MELLGDTYIVKIPPPPCASGAWFLRKEDAEQIEDDIQRRIEDTGPPPGVDISAELVGMKRNVSDARDLADCVVMATSAKLEAAMKRFPGEDPTNKKL